MLVLGLESSCDETAAAIVRDGRETISEVIASQASLHSHFGGVVPEIASRQHASAIIPVIDACLKKARLGWKDIDAIAVTSGPGLVGALLIAVTAAKAIQSVTKKPLYEINHIAGHIAANFLAQPDLQPPFVCLVASGGHSHLVLVEDYTKYKILGRTRDDAAGEAFDKVARVLGLGYPGGPAIERAARSGDPTRYRFPEPKISAHPLDFSFSGLKTQALKQYQQARQAAQREHRPFEEIFSVQDFAASFQAAIVQILVNRTMAAAEFCQCDTIALAGGVAANRLLREAMAGRAAESGKTCFCPPLKLCTDNAEMIAAAGYFEAAAGRLPATTSLNAKPAWRMEARASGQAKGI